MWTEVKQVTYVAPTGASTCLPCCKHQSGCGRSFSHPWLSSVEAKLREPPGLVQSSAGSGLKMSSSDEQPGPIPSGKGDVPGEKKSIKSTILDKAAHLIQSFDPISQFQQHVCTWALPSHDMRRQIETHHYCARLNEDFLQCAVYDSDESDARLIGVEYIVSDRLFEALPDEEKKLWHSHAYEIKSGLWVNPGVPETIQQQELKKLSKTYGKFWCTWQFDRGDRLPMGPPALMMSPQPDRWGEIPSELVEKRDKRYGISTQDILQSRVSLEAPPETHPLADYWRRTGKGFAVDLKEVPMSLKSGSPLSTLSSSEEDKPPPQSQL